MATTTSALSGDQDRLYERAERALPGAGLGGYSLPEDVRFVIDDARGARLIAADGREYIDYVCGHGMKAIDERVVPHHEHLHAHRLRASETVEAGSERTRDGG